ncbi:hypothetical protein [Duganella sp. LjRoot269]|uniref:hypothetical protein n=1 Tax=Duganella sp. LjRoot269 TaxID=3342305 RepID=UPI003ED15899
MDATTAEPGKKVRADGQISGLAGEFFVAAELLKRGLQTSVTFGNAKSIDLLAHCPQTERVFIVQVKTVRSRNWFLLNRQRIKPDHVYVFVILNRPGAQVQYFILRGTELLENDLLFAKGFADPKMPGVAPTSLARFQDNWAVFDPAKPDAPDQQI